MRETRSSTTDGVRLRTGLTGLLLLVSLHAGLAPAGARAEGLLVAAAASLREPAAEIARRFEVARPDVPVAVSFGASSLLAAQIRAGAGVDVLLSADAAIVDALAAEGRLAAGSRVDFARNRLVVVAAPDLPLAAPEDLLRDDVQRIALPVHVVPVGRYARGWLERRGLREAVEARLIRTEHARATLAAVDLGHADAAIVYATDARVARSARVAFEIPPGEHPEILYSAAAVRASARLEGARAFLAFLGGPEARAALLRAGFAAPDAGFAAPDAGVAAPSPGGDAP